MKTKISFLTLIFSMFVFTLILFSCAKEELLPITDTSNISIEPVIDKTDLSTSGFTTLENNFQNEQVHEINMTFKEALERIGPDLHPDWKVAIKAFTCIREGETLLAYNPESAILDFYDSSRFLVLWFKDGKPVRGTNWLKCVCKGKYAAIVLNRTTLNGIGIAFYSIQRACYETDKVPTSSVDN